MIRHSIWKPFVAFASLLALLLAPVMLGKTLRAAENREIVIVALGDSLTAGYQLPPRRPFRSSSKQPCAHAALTSK